MKYLLVCYSLTSIRHYFCSLTRLHQLYVLIPRICSNLAIRRQIIQNSIAEFCSMSSSGGYMFSFVFYYRTFFLASFHVSHCFNI